MRKINPLDERKRDLSSTGLCNLLDFKPEKKTALEFYIFDFSMDTEAKEMLKMGYKHFEFVYSELERLERITKAIMALDKKTVAEACHIAEAIQYIR